MNAAGTRAALRRSVSASGRCVVTSAVPQGASAGIAAFARGGNAFDAVLAACFVETVALPMKCGLAGDLVALFRQAGGPWRTLLSIGAGGGAIANGAKLERTGPRSVGVPGAPHGFERLHGMASLPLDTLVEPAVQAATHGVEWTETSLAYLADARELLQRWSPDCEYLRHLEARPGDRLQLPGLGELLLDFARRGSALFVGEAGRMVAAQVRSLGGWLAAEDFSQRPARVAEPLRLALPGGQFLYVTPSPTQGPLLAEVVRRAMGAGLGVPAPEAMVEDASFDGSRLAHIVEQVRAEARRRGAGSPGDAGTSVASAADAQGNAVVVVHSNSFPRFGSGVVLPNGLVLNNRPGRGFDLEAPVGAPSAPAAGAVPPTTLHAWLHECAGGATLGATPGGVNQLSWNSQSLVELLGGMSPGDVVLRPRWGILEGGSYQCEQGVVLDASRFASTAMGPLSLGSVQQMIRFHADGRLQACADPRTGARAAALF